MITTPGHRPGPSGMARYAGMSPGIGIFTSPTTTPPRTGHHAPGGVIAPAKDKADSSCPAEAAHRGRPAARDGRRLRVAGTATETCPTWPRAVAATGKDASECLSMDLWPCRSLGQVSDRRRPPVRVRHEQPSRPDASRASIRRLHARLHAGTQRARPLRPELAAALGVCPPLQLARCAVDLARWRL